jgi:hypothetical protein
VSPEERKKAKKIAERIMRKQTRTLQVPDGRPSPSVFPSSPNKDLPLLEKEVLQNQKEVQMQLHVENLAGRLTGGMAEINGILDSDYVYEQITSHRANILAGTHNTELDTTKIHANPEQVVELCMGKENDKLTMSLMKYNGTVDEVVALDETLKAELIKKLEEYSDTGEQPTADRVSPAVSPPSKTGESQSEPGKSQLESGGSQSAAGYSQTGGMLERAESPHYYKKSPEGEIIFIKMCNQCGQ